MKIFINGVGEVEKRPIHLFDFERRQKIKLNVDRKKRNHQPVSFDEWHQIENVHGHSTGSLFLSTPKPRCNSNLFINSDWNQTEYLKQRSQLNEPQQITSTGNGLCLFPCVVLSHRKHQKQSARSVFEDRPWMIVWLEIVLIWTSIATIQLSSQAIEPWFPYSIGSFHPMKRVTFFALLPFSSAINLVWIGARAFSN